MDMIEYSILTLAFQARGIREVVPNHQETDESLEKAADLLARAAGARHDYTSPPDDGTSEAQRRLLHTVEEHLAARGVYVDVVPRSRRDEFVAADRISLARLSVEELLSRIDEATAELRRRDQTGGWEP